MIEYSILWMCKTLDADFRRYGILSIFIFYLEIEMKLFCLLFVLLLFFLIKKFALVAL